MKISSRLASARESGTARIAAIAREMAASGKTVFNLSVGEPDFDTPGFIIEAAHRAVLDGQTRYTDVAGTSELREAVAAKFSEENSIDCAAADVIVGTGAKQLIFNALLASVDAGDEVIIPVPSWVSYPDMVTIAGGVSKLVQCGPHSGFKITAELLEAAITPETRWLILNSPGNPTGAVYTSEELAELADVLRPNPQVAIASDDIYEKILFEGREFATMAQVAPDLAGRTLTVNGVSKSMAMTGWRIGYATGPAGLVAAMKKLQGQSTTNASSVGQAAALAALRNREAADRFIEECVKAYEFRRNLVHSELSDIGGIESRLPEGAFYHFIGCSELIGARAPDGAHMMNDGAICEYLLKAGGVCAVPGTEFGGAGYFRLSFAASEEVLREACNQIRSCLADLQLVSVESGAK